MIFKIKNGSNSAKSLDGVTLQIKYDGSRAAIIFTRTFHRRPQEYLFSVTGYRKQLSTF